MKTLTKILSVTALIVLCVCLFTLTAFAANPTVVAVEAQVDPSCSPKMDGKQAYTKLSNNTFYRGDMGKAVGEEVTPEDIELWAPSKVSESSLIIPWYTAHSLTETDVTGDCQTRGERYWTCPKCGLDYKDAEGKTEGRLDTGYGPHDVDPTDPKGPTPASCFQAGTIEYFVCKKCFKPTNSTGTITYKESDVIIPADPSLHQWTDWEILKPQTNVSPGQKKHTCSLCGAVEYEEIPADGITDGEPIYYVIATRDTWLRGEEPLTFESNLVAKLNGESGPNANYVGVRIGTDSLYENSYDTFDFWSWDGYVKLGEKTMAGLREGTYRLWIYDKRHLDVYTNSAVFYVVDVPTLEPYSTDKHVVNSSKSLRFIASEEIRPDSVMVGSRKLYDSSDYFVSNDRKSITLSADFLNARQTGTYTISALTKDGRTIKTNFYILSTAQASSSPRTGDESQIGLWAAFLLLSGAAIVVMVPKLRRHGAK